MNAPLSCELCPRLVESRRMVVNGAGPLPSRVVVVAQNPGRLEEIDGEPLIGWSGNKLVYYASLAGLVDLPDREEWDLMGKEEREETLTAARQSLRRENVVRCRPPKKLDGSGDEAPTAKEIKNCRPFLEGLLVDYPPQFIVTLGSPAWKWFNKDSPLSTAHGLTFQYLRGPDYRITTIIPMYHPATSTPNRRPQLAEVMEMDWVYLGHVLRDEGEEYKAQFLVDRLNYKFNEVSRRDG